MKLTFILSVSLLFFIIAQSFVPSAPAADAVQLLPKLSDYNIYAGDYGRLVPQKEFVPYRLATPLFSDYAEKERLIKVPAGQTIGINGDGLPQFPDGTILVKTFFYRHTITGGSTEKRIIETRILLKSNDRWLAGTYLWNDSQTDALLPKGGEKIPVQLTHETGTGETIQYRVPTSTQCANCHNSGNTIMPIGFSIRNLNIMVPIAGVQVNQLRYFNSLGILPAVDPSSFASLPAWDNKQLPLEQRARAYLEVNCAHCHNATGYCAKSGFRPSWNNTFEATGIPGKKDKIIRLLKKGRMPLLGTTVVHREGLALIQAWIDRLTTTSHH